jgi:DNA-binding CsgD family transcriptional regulator/PAS domain-containing protein
LEKQKRDAMSDSEDIALKLAGMAYDAALDEHQWQAFLEAFAHAVGASSSLLRSADMQAGKAGFVASIGYDPAWQTAYCNHFIKADYLVPALNQLKVGEVGSSDRILNLSEQRKTEYFNDYSIPQDKVHAMGAILEKKGNHTLTFGVQRGKHAGEFGAEETRLMSLLAPHVSRAVHVHRKINAITAEKKYAHGALDQLRMGVILTNPFGVPLYLNRAAELMMTQAVGLGIVHNKLALFSPSETAQLHKLIANAAQGANGSAVGGDMRITMPNKVEFLLSLIAPVSPEIKSILNAPIGTDCVAVFLSKPDCLQLSPKRLVTLYRITPAEARLAARLAALRTVEEASDDLGIAVSTARSQLKSVFAKTGTQSQSELLMMLATGALAHCSNA